ncbi:MAG: hypothetical protein V5A88_01130 [Candidatus Thermoplasmatota archaeon]
MKDRKDRKDIFESMKYLSDMDLSGFTNMLEQQERVMKNFNGVMNRSAAFGKDMRKLIEQNNQQYERLNDIWADFSDISEEMVEENIDEEFSEKFRGYNEEIRDNLKGLVESSQKDAEELYSRWTKISDSFFQGVKAGTGPNPDDVVEAIADFHQTALHIATRNIEESSESMRELRELLDDLREDLNEKMKENVETSNERYEEFMEDWLNSVNRMQDTVEDYRDEIEENYLSSLEPYFGKGSIMPLFPWVPQQRLREYEGEIEELKEKIEELEKKMEEK